MTVVEQGASVEHPTSPAERRGQAALGDGRGVPVVHWDPLRRSTRWGRESRLSHPVRNFGDLLGPMIVAKLARDAGLSRPRHPSRRLVAVGSILHFAETGDVVWGTGINPKGQLSPAALRSLDIRAVRGPRTAAVLTEQHGIHTPAVYGDPGLLLPIAFPPVWGWTSQTAHELTVIPNLNDLAPRVTLPPEWRRHVVTPRASAWGVIRRIARSRLVVGSSLHAIIVAEALGIPARAVVTPHEDAFKYEDYYLGTGREPAGLLAPSVEAGIRMGGAPALDWDPGPLLRAFPADLWC